MSESLVLRLDAWPAETAAWVVVDQTGALVGPAGAGPLVEAARVATGRQVVALLPAVDVLRTRADVPVKAGSKLLQALPFALEENLAEDVDALHFAAGPRDADGKVAVAVVRRDTMDGWTQRLRATGLQPARMHAECDAIGTMPNTATLLVQSDSAVLAEPAGDISATDGQSLDAFLDLWLARRTAVQGGDAPLHLVVYGAADLLTPLAPLWESLRGRVESLDVRVLAEGALPRLAAQIVTSPGINLLQGDYAQHSGLATYWPAWRQSVALLATLALLGGAASWLELRRMRAEEARLDQAIDQAFHYLFPDAGPVVDPRRELSARLAQLGDQGGGSNEFLDVLRVVAQAAGAAGGIRIEGINYRTGTLDLRLRAPSVEALDKMREQVSQAGLSAQIQSANASGNEVVGRLQIGRTGA